MPSISRRRAPWKRLPAISESRGIGLRRRYGRVPSLRMDVQQALQVEPGRRQGPGPATASNPRPARSGAGGVPHGGVESRRHTQPPCPGTHCREPLRPQRCGHFVRPRVARCATVAAHRLAAEQQRRHMLALPRVRHRDRAGNAEACSKRGFGGRRLPSGILRGKARA